MLQTTFKNPIKAFLIYYVVFALLFANMAFMQWIWHVESIPLQTINAILFGIFSVWTAVFFCFHFLQPEKGIRYALFRSLVLSVAYIFLFIALCATCIFSFLTGIEYADISIRLGDALLLATGIATHSPLHTPHLSFGEALPGVFNARRAYILQIVLGMLSIFSSLGIFALADLFGISRLRKRMATPNLSWTLHTRVVTSYLLLATAVGTLAFYFFEKQHLLQGELLVESLITSFFHVSSALGAGYRYIGLDTSSASITQWVLVVLLFFRSPMGSAGIMPPEFFYAVFRKKVGKVFLLLLAIAVGAWILIIVKDTGHSYTLLEQTQAYTSNMLQQLPTKSMSSDGLIYLLQILPHLLYPFFIFGYLKVFFRNPAGDNPL